jgi:hypothetical protein
LLVAHLPWSSTSLLVAPSPSSSTSSPVNVCRHRPHRRILLPVALSPSSLRCHHCRHRRRRSRCCNHH